MNTIYLEPAMVPAALRGAYTGRMFSAVVAETMTIPADAGLWSSGSRDTFHAIEFETGRAASPVNHSAAPWDCRREVGVTLKPGFCVVRHSMVGGKDYSLTFYIHPENAAKLLPAPLELSEFEKIVLSATARFKSSHGGRDRYMMAQDDRRWGPEEKAPFPTRAQWDETKQALIARGLLNKAGAITPAGRNAAK